MDTNYKWDAKKTISLPTYFEKLGPLTHPPYEALKLNVSVACLQGF